ncbi:MAG TPA: hypothetical protein VJP77_05965, partial [Planctomycetota bacterium]|nr:hypothetical protein [Planctomycetota bacterium]
GPSEPIPADLAAPGTLPMHSRPPLACVAVRRLVARCAPLALLAPLAAGQLVTGPTLVGDPAPGSSGLALFDAYDGTTLRPVALGGRILYVGSSPATGDELFASDGTPDGTGLLHEFEPGPEGSSPKVGAVLDDWVFGNVITDAGGREPFVTDGTSAGTQWIDLTPGPGYTSIGIAGGHANKAYFMLPDPLVLKKTLWECDRAGTISELPLATGTHPVGLTGFDSYGVGWTSAGRGLWFVADADGFGIELWRLDPEALVLTVFDLVPGDGNGFPGELVALGDSVVTHATWQGRTHLLRFDPDGTFTSLALLGGTGYPAGTWDLAGTGEQVFFELGGNPWATDGTPAGTRQLADLTPPGPNPPYQFLIDPVAAGPAVYFWLATGDGSGDALYRADFAPDSVTYVAAPAPAPFGGAWVPFQPILPIGSSGLVGMRRYSAAFGTEFWVTDGGAPLLAADIAPGPADSTPAWDPEVWKDIVPWFPDTWQRAGGEFFVQGDDGATGLELHALPVAALGGYVAEPYGPSCGDAAIGATGEARVGHVLTVELASAPLSPALLFLGLGQTWNLLPGGCTQLVAAPFHLLTKATDAAGAAAAPTPVPNDPLFVGLELALQWAVVAPDGLRLSDGLEVVIGS